MNINLLYLNAIEDNNIIYSVDMLRLKTYIDFWTFSEIEFYFKTSCKDKIEKFWLSDRPMCFHYNYKIEIEEGIGFYFGFMQNQEKVKYYKEDIKYNFTIEFNPNKVKDNSMLKYLLAKSNDWYIRSIDLAMDLKVNILDLIPDISGRAKMNVVSYGFDDKTIYLGTGDSRVKIYNKKKESKLDIPGDLTRVEISLQFDDFPLSDIKNFYIDDIFPNIYLNDYVYSLGDYKDKTLFVCLYAVQCGFALRDLSRRYREKIESLLEGGHKVRFNKKTATEAVRRTIFYYFLQIQHFN